MFSISESLIRHDMINGQFQGFLALSREDRLRLSEKMLMEEKRRLRDREGEMAVGGREGEEATGGREEKAHVSSRNK